MDLYLLSPKLLIPTIASLHLIWEVHNLFAFSLLRMGSRKRACSWPSNPSLVKANDKVDQNHLLVLAEA